MTLYQPICIYCDKEPSRGESLFCSKACKEGYSKDPPQSITCSICDAQIYGLEAAEEAGWQDLEMDVEGRTWNFLGTCPECVKEEERERQEHTEP